MKKILKYISVILVATIFTSCRNTPVNTAGNDSTDKTSKTVVRIGYVPLISAYPLYTAVKEGYFKEQGIDVQLRPIKSGPEGNEALAANNIDVAFSPVPSLVAARVKGIPNDLTSIFGSSIDSPEIKDHRIIVAKSAKFTSIKDLKGKKIAVVGYPGRTSDVLELLDYLEKNGLSEKDVQLIGMPHSEQAAALVAGKIDAAACAEPYITLGLQEKVKTLGANEGFYYGQQPTQIMTYVARQSWLTSNPTLSNKFLMGLKKGWEKSKDREWLVTKGIPSFNKDSQPPINLATITPELAKKMHLPTILPSVTDAGLQHVATQLVKRGPIKTKPTDFKSMIYSQPQVPALAK
jgi:ABC-type nitrate/sulfonate/bicarbonate transport system substrate-binding protein